MPSESELVRLTIVPNEAEAGDDPRRCSRRKGSSRCSARRTSRPEPWARSRRLADHARDPWCTRTRSRDGTSALIADQEPARSESRRVPAWSSASCRTRGVRAAALARGRGLAGRDPRDRGLPRASAGRHGRAADRDGGAPHPGRAEVEIAETDRGGKSTFHGPGQLVCYPILDLTKHGKDVKLYVRNLEEALIRTLNAFDLDGTRIEGLTGVWMPPPADRARGRSRRSASTSPAGSRRTAMR